MTVPLAETHWFVTSEGRRFLPLAPRVEDITITDIAHALSNICRFGGHCRQFYSVAQHSVLVSRMVPPDLELNALMHDAAEAYVGDVIRPIKHSLEGFAAIEEAVAFAIERRFHLTMLSPQSQALIKHADNRALMTERRDLILADGHEWIEDEAACLPHPVTVHALSPTVARRLFMQRWIELRTAHTPVRPEGT